MDKTKNVAVSVVKTVLGCALLGLGFNLFLAPNGLNAGGISGLSMVIHTMTEFASVGTITALINLPLFILSWLKVGKQFLFGSLLGMLFCALFIDVFSFIPAPEMDFLVSALYGGAICGLGIGIVFSAGYSTGGSDIIVRLLKLKWQHVPIGTINICFDFCVAALTGLVFRDINRTLCSGVAIFISGQVVDAVVYRFDYSKVVLIISKEYNAVANAINTRMDRGATFLHGEGTYSGTDTKVVLTAIKRQQISELKEIVASIDPNAFIIVQEAHQVLGDGFARYTKNAL